LRESVAKRGTSVRKKTGGRGLRIKLRIAPISWNWPQKATAEGTGSEDMNLQTRLRSNRVRSQTWVGGISTLPYVALQFSKKK